MTKTTSFVSGILRSRRLCIHSLPPLQHTRPLCITDQFTLRLRPSFAPDELELIAILMPENGSSASNSFARHLSTSRSLLTACERYSSTHPFACSSHYVRPCLSELVKDRSSSKTPAHNTTRLPLLLSLVLLMRPAMRSEANSTWPHYIFAFEPCVGHAKQHKVSAANSQRHSSSVKHAATAIMEIA